MKSRKKCTLFLKESENSRKLNVFSDCSDLVSINIVSLSPETISSVTCSEGSWKHISNLKISPLSSG